MWRILTRFLRSRHSELSRHAVLVAGLCGIFFAFVDFMDSVNNGRFTVSWSVYVSLLVCLITFFLNELPAPSSNKLISWCYLLMTVQFLYHSALSTSHSVTPTMSLESKLYAFFLSTFASSILCLLAFHHILFKVVLQKIFPFEARKQPGIWVILHVSAIVSVACCVCLSQCRETQLEQRYWKKKFSDQYCYSPKLASSESPAGSSDETYLRLSPWATFICVYIVSYVVMPLKSGNQQNKPDFLAMSHWYSGTSLALYKTVFDMVSTNVIQTRFDMRMLQAALNQREEATRDYIYDHFSEKEELWFDFMADTGDGGDSTYTVARLLAQPKILVTDPNPSAEPNQVTIPDPGAQNNNPDEQISNSNQDTEPKLNLKRGNLLLIGGDLAYPNPSESTYERRLFRPFQYALQPPPNHDERMTTNKPVVPPEMPEPYHDVPKCFVIPGNHDWFDGLCTFMRNICHRSWLGGWYMPQKKSYFALKLPKGWWIFGLDLALIDDIDVYQFEFFSKLAKSEEMVGRNDSVIIMTHKPDWLVDWYENGDSINNVSDYQSKGKNVTDLICNILKKRCKLQIAGDIHHYMHHAAVPQPNRNNNEPIKHLLVNGCGGAFTHPTHAFRGFRESRGVSYVCKVAYPSFKQSRRLAFGNIWGFCWNNKRFEYVGGIIYFGLVYSTLSRCDHMSQPVSTWSSFFGRIGNAFIYILEDSNVSLGSATLLLIVAVALVPSTMSIKKRVIIAALHVFVHLATALFFVLLLEENIDDFARNKLIETSAYHSLYRYHHAMLHRELPVPISIQDRIERWAFGLYQAYIKYFMSAFDVYELIAVSRSNICKNGIKSISRWDKTIYYAFTFLFYFILSTVTVSIIFGSYLCICINCFNLYYDEAFSSLRIADYKAFTRFHIKRNGDLEVFTLAVDKVPREWEQDPNWDGIENPSQWRASEFAPEPLETVKIIDKFVIRRKREDSPNNTSGTATEVPGTDSYKVPEQNSLEDKKQKKKKKKSKNKNKNKNKKANVDQNVSAKGNQEAQEKQSEAKKSQLRNFFKWFGY